jgi:hypothetical protein
MNRFLFFLAVALTSCTIGRLQAEEPASKTDPIVGHWIWVGTRNVTVNADGTAKQPGEATAEWKWVDVHGTTERKYEFIWNRAGGRIYIHKLVLSADGQRLDGTNQKGERVWAKRVD